MKRIRNLLLMLLAALLALSSLLLSVGAVNLSASSITMSVGTRRTLTLNGTTKKVKWSSSSKKIATVSAKGVVSAKKKGKCVITATAEGVKYRCKVTVTPKKKVKLKASAAKVYIPLGVNAKKVKITYTGDNRITSSSSNTNVATTSWASGWNGNSTTLTINPVGTGTATITVAEVDGSHRVKIKVTVKRESKVGTVTGNVTFHYSQSRGYLPDTGSKVFLIPRDGSAKKYTGGVNPTEAQSERWHIYRAQVDGVGNYAFDRVVAGSYYVVILSKNTTTGDYYKAQSPENYYKGIADSWSNLLSSQTRTALSKAYGPSRSYEAIITVRQGSNTTASHAFPYSYS